MRLAMLLILPAALAQDFIFGDPGPIQWIFPSEFYAEFWGRLSAGVEVWADERHTFGGQVPPELFAKTYYQMSHHVSRYQGVRLSLMMTKKATVYVCFDARPDFDCGFPGTMQRAGFWPLYARRRDADGQSLKWADADTGQLNPMECWLRSINQRDPNTNEYQVMLPQVSGRCSMVIATGKDRWHWPPPAPVPSPVLPPPSPPPWIDCTPIEL